METTTLGAELNAMATAARRMQAEHDAECRRLRSRITRLEREIREKLTALAAYYEKEAEGAEDAGHTDWALTYYERRTGVIVAAAELGISLES